MGLLIYYIIIHLLFITISNSESTRPISEYCNYSAKINHPQISSNIGTLLLKLVSSTTRNGFSATSSGQAKHRVFGLAQCRGDVSKKNCSTCIQDASKEIRKLCPNEVDARIWYDYCFLRYNSKKFFGDVDTFPSTVYYYENVTNPEEFNNVFGELYDKITKEAIKPANRGLGKGKSKKMSNSLTIYGLVQCTRDLSQLGCAQCLAEAASNFEGLCRNKIGCRVLYSSCYVRYELYPFYFPLNKQEGLDNTSVKLFKSAVSND